MRTVRTFVLALSALALAVVAAMAAAAQPAQKEQSSGAMQGFQANRDQPVKIESDTLEVRDKSQQATFSGNVKLTQGDNILQCRTLVIFYEQESSPPPPKKGAAQPVQAQKASGPGKQQQIKRAEAKGDVLVTQKDQTAKGDNGVFDVKSNTVTLTGNVVVTQGTNVLRGDRMVVNLTTGVSIVESGHSKTGERQRVEGLFNPSTAPPAPAQKDAKDTKPAPAPPAAKQAPGGPIRIN